MYLNLDPKERHLFCFALVFWRYIISSVYPGVWLCSHFLFWLFFNKTQWRPFLFPSFSWEVQEYLLPWRKLIVALGCVACWNHLFMQQKSCGFSSLTRRAIQSAVLRTVGMLFMRGEMFPLWESKVPIISVAPHWNVVQKCSRGNCRAQRLNNFGSEGRAAAFLPLRVSYIIQNSQNFPEISNDWDMYVKCHPKCSHDMKKCFVGIRTVKLQNPFWMEAGGALSLATLTTGRL